MFQTRASRGCTNCRKRRIKCNRQEPVCSQCVRAGKECGGYRSDLALMFQNKTSSSFESEPLKKHTKDPDLSLGVTLLGPSPAEPPTSIHEVRENVPSSVSTFSTSSSSCSTPLSSPLSLEAEGAAFFFRKYILRDLSPKPEEPEFSSLRMKKALNPALLDTIISIGWAGLSNVSGNKDLMVKARLKYGLSLKNTMAALADPSKVVMDETFQAVMLHTIFFMVTNKPEMVLQSGGDHINGAAALAIFQGLDRYKGQQYLKPFLQVCYSTMIICLNRLSAFPDEIRLWLSGIDVSNTTSEWPACTLACIIIDFLALNMRVRRGQPIDPETIVEQCHTIDQKLQDWFIQRPANWRYTTELFAPEDDDETSFTGHCHLYTDIWVARATNHYRWARIMVNELLLDYLAKIETKPGLDAQKQRSLSLISEIATDICDSASTHLYQHTKRKTDEEYQGPVLHGVFTVLFPLKIAASSRGVRTDMKSWVIETLERVGRLMGIMQAMTIATNLRAK